MQYDDDRYVGMSPSSASQLRFQLVVIVLYRIPVLIFLGLGFLWVHGWAYVLLVVGAFTLLEALFGQGTLFLVRVGALVGAYFLGAPLWLVLAIAGVSMFWRWVVRNTSYLMMVWLPRKPKTYVWKAACKHSGRTCSSIHEFARHGRWSDALDASLQVLADHPRAATDCLAGLCLMTAELAVNAEAPEIAIEAGRAADRLIDSDAKNSATVKTRAFLACARAEAQQGRLSSAWSAVERARDEAGDRRAQREGPVAAVEAGVSALTQRTSTNPEHLVPTTLKALGTGDEVGVMLLDDADWYRVAGHPSEALELYELARLATEYDWFVEEVEGAPQVLGRRWSLRGRRWARAVHGQLRSRVAAGEAPPAVLLSDAETAAQVLHGLSEWPALVSLLATVNDADARFGAREDASAQLPAADAVHTQHRYLVLDSIARRRWQDAVRRSRAALKKLADGSVPGDRLADDVTWLAGSGAQVAISGIALGKAVNDIIDRRHNRALEALVPFLGGVGLKDEALAVAQELVDLERGVSGDTEPAEQLAFPLWWLGENLAAVGRRTEALEAHLESLPHYRSSAPKGNDAARICAKAIRNCVLDLMDDERYDEAMPLALEVLRRFTDLAPEGRHTLDIHFAMLRLARIYEHRDRLADASTMLRRALDAALQLAPENEAWNERAWSSCYFLALSYVREERAEDALSVVDEVSSSLPVCADDEDAIWLRYTAFLAASALGDSERAACELQTAVDRANARPDDDPTQLSVFSRCVIFAAAGDQTRAMAYLDAVATDGHRPDREDHMLLWKDLDDLEQTTGPNPIIDEIRRRLPLDDAEANV